MKKSILFLLIMLIITSMVSCNIFVPVCQHNYTSTFVPPTATEDGYTKHTCSACGDTYNDSYVTPTNFIVAKENRAKIGYTGTENGNLVIPATFEYNGTWYRVTEIGYDAFYHCDSLTSVEIPDSVTSIGYEAFYWCTSLTSVVIPDSVTTIGYRAFYNCDSLTSIEIPNSVTSIGNDAFRYCTNLTSIVIPDSVTSIGDFAFFDCYNLTSIVIPDSVTSIGDHAFASCYSLTSIKYRGTQAEWKVIEKGDGWYYNTGKYTIIYNYVGE